MIGAPIALDDEVTVVSFRNFNIRSKTEVVDDDIWRFRIDTFDLMGGLARILGVMFRSPRILNDDIARGKSDIVGVHHAIIIKENFHKWEHTARPPLDIIENRRLSSLPVELKNHIMTAGIGMTLP